MTFFCWIFPGLIVIGLIILLSNLGDNSSLFKIAMLATFSIALVGSGTFAAILKITAEKGREWVTPHSVVLKALRFCLWQILISPSVVIFTSVCFMAIFSVISALSQ